MIKALTIMLGMATPVSAVAEAYLLMAEEPGCHWCAKWNDEIAPIYPKSAEGQAVPLRRYDLRADAPDVVFARRVHFTPTFILVEDGREVGRIEGYPGQDFFWGLLGMMLDDAGVVWRRAGSGPEGS
ncbi:hypothetical protein SAMN05444279_107112 [Ruegeria intermedia]|uniref:Thioredoxin-like domain-containing protein n=1 Tax=Ruegeria intermedia TaxID=996115 RepID=A0A1M4W1L8_9RHOB|nr:hypothetical protein [Ruegeria intermedia]SHE75174.1 hypothetical protein SAMN05444279_107112 [Ruegeria intermedia]